MKDYYEVLKVHPAVSDEDLKLAYFRLSHKYHPDKEGGDENKFKEIKEAFDILSDPGTRFKYNIEWIRYFDLGVRNYSDSETYETPNNAVTKKEKGGKISIAWIIIAFVIIVVILSKL